MGLGGGGFGQGHGRSMYGAHSSDMHCGSSPGQHCQANSMDANAGDCGDADWDVPNSCTLSCSPGHTPSTNPVTCTAADTCTAVTCQGTFPCIDSALCGTEGTIWGTYCTLWFCTCQACTPWSFLTAVVDDTIVSKCLMLLGGGAVGWGPPM